MKLLTPVGSLLCVGAFFFVADPAAAQLLSTTYVATAGSDASACNRQAPCSSLAGAVGKTDTGGSVICLDETVSGPLTITRPITIDCGGHPATIRDAAGGIVINIGTGGTGLGTRSVRLRGINIFGASNNGGYFRPNGIDILVAPQVFLEDVTITDTIDQGIYDRRTAAQSRLYIKNSTIANSRGPGIICAAAGTSAAVLDNVSLLNNTYGLAAATGNNVVIARSTISGNTIAGIATDGGSQINLLNSVMSHNTAHVNNYGAVRLQENTLQFSNIAVQGSAPISLGANRFTGNGSLGTAPVPATGASADVFN